VVDGPQFVVCVLQLISACAYLMSLGYIIQYTWICRYLYLGFQIYDVLVYTDLVLALQLMICCLTIHSFVACTYLIGGVGINAHPWVVHSRPASPVPSPLPLFTLTTAP